MCAFAVLSPFAFLDDSETEIDWDERCPIVYSEDYNISFFGIEKCHPFDSNKWGNVFRFLIASGALVESAVLRPIEAKKEHLLMVHSKKYLRSLNGRFTLTRILEVGLVLLFPICLIDRRILRPMRIQTGGTVLAARVSLMRGWAINIGGGFHHASEGKGGGFCVYADVTLAIKLLFANELIKSAMIVDVDAHQGNGHETDFASDSRVYILDLFNASIYPGDTDALKSVSRAVPLPFGAEDDFYLRRLEMELDAAFADFSVPDFLLFVAGTDSLIGDPLGGLSLSPKAIIRRDEIVFGAAIRRRVPITMVTSGGYTNRMCVTFLALADGLKGQSFGGKYKMILLNNRDEKLDRVTSELCWKDGILACWDEQAEEHGTWLGIDRKGRVGVLLSVTEPPHTLKKNAPSRGAFVKDFLNGTFPPDEFLSEIAKKQQQLNGFQLLLMDSLLSVGPSSIFSLSNRFPSKTEEGRTVWPHGVYGFGNSPRHLPFQKVNYGEKLFQKVLNEFDFARRDESELVQTLFGIASDRTILFPDDQIRQQTGCSQNSDAYKFLCSIFVDGSSEGINYGTTSTSVLLVDIEGTAVFHERRLANPQRNGSPFAIKEGRRPSSVGRLYVIYFRPMLHFSLIHFVSIICQLFL
ncbi:hypothetical protein niasHT_013603 [Heterodera trifolii]|uniref:Histone deacetylase n=1 Tax=Heterodera trifolii TaxID=157864 RepID=A0ABD2LE68_9BILA